MSIARPPVDVMRSPLKNQLKKQALIGLAFALAGSASWYFLVSKPRKQAYATFHQTYDEDRHFKRMVNAGVFDSVKPDAAPPSWVADYEKEVDKAIAALKKK